MGFIDEIKTALLRNGNEIKFSESVHVKATPHTPMERIICVFLSDRHICYETRDMEMKFLEEAQEIIINSILQRIKLLQYQKTLK